MNTIGEMFANFTPGTYGIWAGVLMFAAWWLREYRETRKLSLDDRNARREGYAKQVEMLMKECRERGHDLAELRKEYDNYRILCKQETDQLRKNFVAVENEVTGFKRVISTVHVELTKLLRLEGMHNHESLESLTAILDQLKVPR